MVFSMIAEPFICPHFNLLVVVPCPDLKEAGKFMFWVLFRSHNCICVLNWGKKHMGEMEDLNAQGDRQIVMGKGQVGSPRPGV